MGNRTSVTIPSGTVDYTFDEWNRLETVINGEEITTYAYDGVSNLVRTEFPNGVVETREYDELDRLLYLENTLDDSIISSYTYTLDKVGNRLSVEEQDGRLVEYDYDDLYRLVEEKITDTGSVNDGRVIGYTYDFVGNRLIRDDSLEGVTSYTYNENDWLLTEVTVNNGETVSVAYRYDDNGNTIARIKDGTEETTYIWDYENRLVEVKLPDGSVIGYVYDDEGIRVSTSVDGVTTHYLVDKNRPYAQVLEEYVAGELEVRYVYGHDLISQEREGETAFYQVDGLGNTRVLTDEMGGVVQTYTYDGFGELIESTGEVENRYQFTGEQYDEGLDQYYLRQRYYDPEIGRFTRRDTFEGIFGEPITLHKYLYANDNPVSYVDPSGNIGIRGVLLATILVNILWDAVNPFDFNGINLLADDPLSGVDPTDFAPLSKAVIDTVHSAFDVAYTPILGAIWSSGKLTSPENALRHWKRHKHEFPNLNNSVEYVQEAQNFVDYPPATALKKTRSNGDLVIYDPPTKIFAIKSSSGEPRTMFKPDPAFHGYPTNEDYFYAQ